MNGNRIIFIFSVTIEKIWKQVFSNHQKIITKHSSKFSDFTLVFKANEVSLGLLTGLQFPHVCELVSWSVLIWWMPRGDMGPMQDSMARPSALVHGSRLRGAPARPTGATWGSSVEGHAQRVTSQLRDTECRLLKSCPHACPWGRRGLHHLDSSQVCPLPRGRLACLPGLPEPVPRDPLCTRCGAAAPGSPGSSARAGFSPGGHHGLSRSLPHAS